MYGSIVSSHCLSFDTLTMGKGGGDAVDEENIHLCCAVCCVNCGIYNDPDCCGCSGKLGLCCVNCEMCCKPSAPCLPLCCCGPKCECDGCSMCNIQCQLFNLVISGAFPCNEEVPVAVSLLGLTMFPKVRTRTVAASEDLLSILGKCSRTPCFPT